MDTKQPLTSGNGDKICIDDLFDKAYDNPGKNIFSTLISVTDYANAIVELIKLADLGCGGSRAAAQVVLSLYNGIGWQVNLCDLYNLDDHYFNAAITAISGRRKHGIEPHELIKNGQAIFDRLQDEWKHYHVKKRNRK
jgi:hypothetical protein